VLPLPGVDEPLDRSGERGTGWTVRSGRSWLPFAIGIVMVAAACHPERALTPQSIGVSRTSGGNPVLHYVVCPSEFIRRVQFFERDGVARSSDELLWELVVEHPPPAPTEPSVSTITVGDPWVGYVETTALSSALRPDHEYAFVFNSNRAHGIGIRFRYSELRRERVLSYPEISSASPSYVSQSQLLAAGTEKCDAHQTEKT